MSLIFYQRADFYDNENNLIPTTGTFYGEDIEIPLDNNLFVESNLIIWNNRKIKKIENGNVVSL